MKLVSGGEYAFSKSARFKADIAMENRRTALPIALSGSILAKWL
jgi:hypothetical protein